MENILVTGASRGIGKATAVSLAREGRRLVLVARRAGALEMTARDAEARGAKVDVHVCDLSRADHVGELLTAWPDLDGLVLNAGRANDKAFREAQIDEIAVELRLNYETPLAILHHHLPRMTSRGVGCAVMVGSLTSYVPFPGNATYAASKSALYTLIRSLRLEMEHSGVGLGVVLPGFTRTQMTQDLQAPGPKMSAENVGHAVAKCYDRGGGIMVPGLMNGVAAMVFGAFPSTLDAMLMRFDSVVPKPRA